MNRTIKNLATGLVASTALAISSLATVGIAPATAGDVPPELPLSKTADKTSVVAGDTITYTFVATNRTDSGGTAPVPETLSNITISDDLASFTGLGEVSALTCDQPQPATLAVGETLTCTATYLVTQADIDRGYPFDGSGIDHGQIHNCATVTGSRPDGTVVQNYDCEDVEVVRTPEIALEKTVDRHELVVGETATYTFVATNTGNMTLADVAITDRAANFTGAGTISTLSCDQPQPATLAPNETLTCTATYVVEQADVGTEEIDNTAEVFGTPIGGEQPAQPVYARDDAHFVVHETPVVVTPPAVVTPTPTPTPSTTVVTPIPVEAPTPLVTPPVEVQPSTPVVTPPVVQPPATTEQPKVKRFARVRTAIRTGCLTPRFGEAEVLLHNRDISTKPAWFTVKTADGSRTVKLRPGRVQTITMVGLEVGSKIKVIRKGEVLQKTVVPGGCMAPTPPDTGFRMAL